MLDPSAWQNDGPTTDVLNHHDIFATPGPVAPSQMIPTVDPPAQKNLLMIAVDDLNAFATMKNLYPGTLSTPNIDRLMAMGTTFDNAFATTALCNPSRTSILTGKLPTSTGVFYNQTDWTQHVDLGTTLFGALQSAGYDNVGTGKLFHNIPSTVQHQLFSQYFLPEAPAQNYTSDPFHIAPYTGPQSDLQDSQSATWIDDFLHGGHGSQPFFASIGFGHPHTPWHAPQKYYDMYPLDSIKLPYHLNGDRADLPQFIREHNGTGFNESVHAAGAWKELLQAYFASISYVDNQIGRVLDALASSGQAANTAIVLWSDHGYHLGDKDVWHKFTLWDEAGRAPLIMVDPGVTQPGTVVSHTVSLSDIYPTVMDMLGVSPPAGLDGHSLMPLLQNPAATYDQPALTFMYGSWSIRTNDYRLIHYEDGSTELYDINSDPNEWHNLSGQSGYATIQQNLLDQAVSLLGDKHWVQGTDSGATLLSGDSANNIMISDSSHAMLAGAGGGDTYFIWNSHQTVVEAAHAGNDLIYVDLTDAGANYFLIPDNVETMIEERSDLHSAQTVMTLEGNSSSNTIIGANAKDTILCHEGDDIASGQFGDDTINGGAGDDTLTGDSGNDVLSGGLGKDTLDGGDGNDTADYSTATANMNVSLLTGKATGQGTDKLIHIENIVGSSHADMLEGNRNANVITGGLGRDRLVGDGGHDTFCYHAAAESTGTGRDTIVGFNAAVDRLNISGAIKGVAATIAGGAMRVAHFDADLAASVDASALLSHHAVLFRPDSGDLRGEAFLVIDLNGHAGYQSGQDLVIELQDAVGLNHLHRSTFI